LRIGTAELRDLAEREGIRTPEWLPTTTSKLAVALANGDLSKLKFTTVVVTDCS
jgi:hypothetical protein